MSRENQKQNNPKAAAVLVAKGYKLHEAGKLREAEDLYRQSLINDPNSSDTQNVFGLLCIQTNRFEEAIKLIQQALNTQAGNPQSHYNLAIAFKELGQMDEAEKHFRKSASLAPGNFQAFNSLGVILRLQGKTDDAVKSLKSALKANPFYAEAHCNLGMTMQEMGEMKQARSCFNRAVEINPGMTEAHIGLAELSIDQNQLKDAKSSIRQALKISPDSSEAHNALGIVLNKQGKTEKAISSFSQAAEISPANTEALMNLGITLEQSGQLEAAEESYQGAIKARPDFANAYYLLAHLKNHRSSDDEIQAALTVFQNSKTSEKQKTQLAFALSCAYESRQQYEDSFNFLQEGHHLKKQHLVFDLAKETDFFKSLAETFNKDFFEQQSNTEMMGESTLFVVGMPRSGTSLTEQILASHPTVYGAGELKLIALTSRKIARETGHPFPQSCKRLDDTSLQTYGRNYLEELKQMSPDAEVITDTNPINFLYIGLIAMLFPGARFINCVRDPMDNCLSIYKHLLADPHSYSHDLKDLGAYFNLYRDLMKHWHAVLPGKIYDLPYEKLVADSEKEIRGLLDFCTLPFDENCLHFHKTSRVVRTPSASHVHQPHYSDTIDLWKHYEQQLKPLQAILNPNKA